MIDFQARFETALSYGAFLDNYGTPEHQRRWADVYERFKLSEVHREVLDTFVREMNVLCMAGAWCGDCVIQCPIFEHFARVCSKIRLRHWRRSCGSVAGHACPQSFCCLKISPSALVTAIDRSAATGRWRMNNWARRARHRRATH